ncbi:MAG: TIGR04282 family arsenosugar biosynthesis glycosyltransferase [Pseudomonadota bacterium]
MTRSVFIFAKPPMMGRSKTRLAKGIGKAHAQRIARMGFARTLKAARDPRWRLTLYTSPASVLGASLGGLWPKAVDRRDQGSGDLGDRLSRAYRAADPGLLLFIGSDCPDISASHLWRAFRLLSNHEAVAGPVNDGGFWLLGLNTRRRRHPPFDGVRWSTQHALSDVVENLNTPRQIAYLPTLIDIDTAEDWRRWIRQ